MDKGVDDLWIQQKVDEWEKVSLIRTSTLGSCPSDLPRKNMPRRFQQNDAHKPAYALHMGHRVITLSPVEECHCSW